MCLVSDHTVWGRSSTPQRHRRYVHRCVSLQGQTRACIISALKHQRSLVQGIPHSLSTFQTITQWFSYAPRRSLGSDLEGIPEANEDGAQHLPVQQRNPKERSMLGVFSRKTTESPQSTMKPSISKGKQRVVIHSSYQ